MDKVIVESDLQNTVKWVSEATTTAWKINATLMSMEYFKSQLKNWCVVKILRSANGLVDSFAKLGCKEMKSSFWLLVMMKKEHRLY